MLVLSIEQPAWLQLAGTSCADINCVDHGKEPGQWCKANFDIDISDCE